MTIDIEDQLAAGMREQATDLTLTRDVLGAATRRHRRRTALHRTAYAAGVVGVAGALTAALTVGAPGDTGSSGPVAGRSAPAAAQQSPQLRLAAAAAASENISYRVKVTTTNKDKLPPSGELPEPVLRSWVTKGALDPATATGYLEKVTTGGLVPPMYTSFPHERLVDGVKYVGAPNGSVGSKGEIVWTREKGKQDSLDYDLAMGGKLGASADPGELFRVLRQAGATVSDNPGGGYHFEVTVHDTAQGVADDKLVGDVTIGADKRIKTVAYDRVARWQLNGDFTYHLHVLVEFSDYGLPVKVEVPANALVLGK
ncbi:hypothetical protein [Micromonospora sp. NPDC004551]|uniref:hypothetical protein n=1 Tax=Micromonospora sp. NPDC004551 TaxID=3154284 RepID=UPI0033B2FD8A